MATLLQSDGAAGLDVRRKSYLHLDQIIVLQKSERSESVHFLSKLVHGLAATLDGKISRLVLGGVVRPQCISLFTVQKKRHFDQSNDTFVARFKAAFFSSYANVEHLTFDFEQEMFRTLASTFFVSSAPTLLTPGTRLHLSFSFLMKLLLTLRMTDVTRINSRPLKCVGMSTWTENKTPLPRHKLQVWVVLVA